MVKEVKESKFKRFITNTFLKVVKKESVETLGDRNTYIGASDIGGCPFAIVEAKKNPPDYSIEKQIVFQRGHIAEEIVRKMLDGLNMEEQYEALGKVEGTALKAHIDKLIKFKNKRRVIVEVKTTDAPVDEPYESWVLQVQYQMGLMLEESDYQIEAYVLAMDLNSGWFETFPVKFEHALYDVCMAKAKHISDAMQGKVEPKAIVQGYCSECHCKMKCPKRGKYAEELPREVALDIIFIKLFQKMKKEYEKRLERVKRFFESMGIETAKVSSEDIVVTFSPSTYRTMDVKAFKKDHPELYKKYLREPSDTNRLQVM